MAEQGYSPEGGDLLPEGWYQTSLDQVATWGSGGTPSRKEPAYYNGNIPWIKTGDLGIKFVCESSEHISELAVKNSSAKFFPKGSVAIAMYGATIGKTSILGIDATTNQACGVGTPINEVTFSEFLYYFLLNEKDNFIAKGKGGAQPNISQALIKAHEILLPPLAEQKIIADKLDTLLAQVETTKARLERIPNILKSFRQSVLAAAVSGKLTEEWRTQFTKGMVPANTLLSDLERERKDSWSLKGKYKGPVIISDEVLYGTLPKTWAMTCLDQLVESNRPICYGILMPKENLEDGVLYVKVRDMKGDVIDVNNLQRTSIDIANKYSRSSLREGDILVSIRGTYGKIVVVPKELSGGNITQDSARVSVHPMIDTKYIMYALRSEYTQRYFQHVAKGVAVKGVNIGDLRPLPIPVPPVDEQTEIVHRVEELFAFADTIEQKANAALDRVNNLTQSILAKAFRGELTAEWRAANPDLISGENSAEALLEKIKAERKAMKKQPK